MQTETPYCSNCGSSRFHFSQFEVYTTEDGAIGDAEESGLDSEAGATCRGCGHTFDSDTEVWKLIETAWETKWR